MRVLSQQGSLTIAIKTKKKDFTTSRNCFKNYSRTFLPAPPFIFLTLMETLPASGTYLVVGKHFHLSGVITSGRVIHFYGGNSYTNRVYGARHPRLQICSRTYNLPLERFDPKTFLNVNANWRALGTFLHSLMKLPFTSFFGKHNSNICNPTLLLSFFLLAVSNH